MANKKIIVAVVGRSACGKGTVAKYIEKKYQAGSFRFSTILRDVLNRLHLEISRHSMQKLSTLLRKNYREDILAKIIAKDVSLKNKPIVVVDGVRRFADIKHLKKLNGYKLVKIEADAKIRYQRLLERTENTGDSKKTFKAFLEDEKKEADAEIPKVMKRAELTLNNNGSIEDLYKQCDNIINSILSTQK